jgi:sulfur relay (sulfurtransferase) DsrC/TusE family protein
MGEKWEYNWRKTTAGWDENVDVALAEMMDEADKLGQNGWEMVNFSVINHYSQGVGEGPTVQHAATRYQNKLWTVAAMFKRPPE